MLTGPEDVSVAVPSTSTVSVTAGSSATVSASGLVPARASLVPAQPEPAEQYLCVTVSNSRTTGAWVHQPEACFVPFKQKQGGDDNGIVCAHISVHVPVLALPCRA